MILGVVGGGLVLLAGGCAALGYAGVKLLTAPVDASNDWLDAVQSGDFDRADELACSGAENGLRAQLSRARSESWGEGQTLNASNITNGVAVVTGTIDRSGPTQIQIVLGKSDSRGAKGWCVSGFSLG